MSYRHDCAGGTTQDLYLGLKLLRERRSSLGNVGLTKVVVLMFM